VFSKAPVKTRAAKEGNLSKSREKKLTEKQSSSNLMTERSKRKTDGSLEGGTWAIGVMLEHSK